MVILSCSSPRWAFLFDKVMLLCRKVTRLGFDVRYSPKQVFTVSTLSVDQVTSTKGGKVSDLALPLAVAPTFTVFPSVLIRIPAGGERSR